MNYSIYASREKRIGKYEKVDGLNRPSDIACLQISVILIWYSDGTPKMTTLFQ